jgi:hypothetical protein
MAVMAEKESGTASSRAGVASKGYRRAAQALSFCLPGLGQVYAGAWGRGVALNVAFLLLLSQSATRFLVPFLAAFAAWEAGRLPAEFAAARATRPRQSVFALGGGLGVFLWFVTVLGEWGPWNAVLRTREAVSRAGVECRRDDGYDASCVGAIRDGWGRALVVSGVDGQPRSLGRDGKDGTLDDVGAPSARSAPVVPGAFDVASPR